MKQILLDAFNNALQNYCQKKNRGYRFGIFTSWRHSFRKTPKLSALENNLKNSKDDESALMVLIDHLLAKDATFNNHSFNNYLIDELQKSTLNQIDWACFTQTATKTYEGVLYRGTSQPPSKIFNEGFKELRSSNFIEDYIKFKNNSIGISTSKDYSTAETYALDSHRSHRERYVYLINYRNKLGFDILESGKARGLSFNMYLHINRYNGLQKKEVNIKGNISHKDVLGAWEVQKGGKLIWQTNPNYDWQQQARSSLRK